jgi:hypothetical protein
MFIATGDQTACSIILDNGAINISSLRDSDLFLDLFRYQAQRQQSTSPFLSVLDFALVSMVSKHLLQRLRFHWNHKKESRRMALTARA